MRQVYQYGLAVVGLSVVAVTASAQAFGNIIPEPEDLDLLPQTGDDFIALVEGVIFWLGAILGAIAVLVVLWAGFLFMTAGDSQERQGRAKAWLKWGVIGIIVALFSTIIVPVIMDLLAGGFY